MQRMISHADDLPRCAAGHRARHMHDLRGRHAGGGHFIECACRHTARRDSYEQALADWQAHNGYAAAPHRAQVLTLRAGGAKGAP